MGGIVWLNVVFLIMNDIVDVILDNLIVLCLVLVGVFVFIDIKRFGSSFLSIWFIFWILVCYFVDIMDDVVILRNVFVGLYYRNNLELEEVFWNFI